MTTAQQRKRFRKDQLKVNNFTRIGLRIKNDEKSSYKEHRVDALAPYADEGRGKLR